MAPRARAVKPNERAQRIADAMLGVAQSLETAARAIRVDVASVRAGRLHPGFAASYTLMHAKYNIQSRDEIALLDRESQTLP